MKYFWKLFVFLNVLSITFSTNPFRLQMVSQADDGAYDFAYDTGDGAYHIQSRDNQGTVTGKFAYVDPEGNLREIDYKADDNGFHPSGDIHPKRFAGKIGSNPHLTPQSEGHIFQKPPSVDSPEVLNPELIGITRGADSANEFLRPRLDGLINAPKVRSIETMEPENLEAFVPQLVVGPIPNSKKDSRISGSDSEMNIKSQPISAKPSFPIAPLLSTGTLPDANSDIQWVPRDVRREPSREIKQLDKSNRNENTSLISGLLSNIGETIGDRKVIRHVQYFSNPNAPPPSFNPQPLPQRPSFSVFSPVQDFLDQHRFQNPTNPTSQPPIPFNIQDSRDKQRHPHILPNFRSLQQSHAMKRKYETSEVVEDQQPKHVLNTNHSRRLQNTLTKLMSAMPIDYLLRTLENLASQVSDTQKRSPLVTSSEQSKDRQPVLPVSTRAQSLEPQVNIDEPTRQELLQVMFRFQKILEKTNLTQQVASETLSSSSNVTNRDEASVDIQQTPFLGSPLYTPVEGVREVDGHKVLHRTYIPFTRRYGYVYTQRKE